MTYPVTITVDTTTLQGAKLLTGMTANVTITRAQRSSVLLLPASAITFARAAANASAGGFLTRSATAEHPHTGTPDADALEQQNSQISQDNPTVAWVVERNNNQWVVKPVVLGLTNGTVYEVLAGLNANDSVVIGEQNGSINVSSSSSTTSGTGTGRGGFGGGVRRRRLWWRRLRWWRTGGTGGGTGRGGNGG